MRDIRTYSTWIVLAAAFLLGGSTLSAAQHEHKSSTLAVGQKGEINLTSETRIADTTLKPGRYYVDHRVDGAAHYIHFTEMTPKEHQKRQGARDAIGERAVAHPGEIQCELETLAKKASRTTVLTTKENGIRRITRIEITGEDVAHIF